MLLEELKRGLLLSAVVEPLVQLRDDCLLLLEHLAHLADGVAGVDVSFVPISERLVEFLEVSLEVFGILVEFECAECVVMHRRQDSHRIHSFDLHKELFHEGDFLFWSQSFSHPALPDVSGVY